MREQLARVVAIIRGLVDWEILPDKMVETRFGRKIVNGYASKEGCYMYADSICALILKWLEEPCRHHPGLEAMFGVGVYKRKDCAYCIAELIAELKGESQEKVIDGGEK